ncbi:unnamed protein product [Penicillium salamii]|nr:unnamed protein product [Penicillium salamii]
MWVTRRYSKFLPRYIAQKGLQGLAASRWAPLQLGSSSSPDAAAVSLDSHTVYSIVATTSDLGETGLNASRWAAPALLPVANPGTAVSTEGRVLLASPALAEAELPRDKPIDPNATQMDLDE